MIGINVTYFAQLNFTRAEIPYPSYNVYPACIYGLPYKLRTILKPICRGILFNSTNNTYMDVIMKFNGPYAGGTAAEIFKNDGTPLKITEIPETGNLYFSTTISLR